MAAPQSPLKQQRGTDEDSLIDVLKLLPRQIRSLGCITDCHKAARSRSLTNFFLSFLSLAYSPTLNTSNSETLAPHSNRVGSWG
jgi:hypothetical protein